ncbi:hypothetical protein JCM3766R1_006755 [Sporobolomyces carnicolor]
MKLDATDLRYISADAFRVLAAVEQGSKNHEVVPSPLIAQLSGARSGGVNKALGELAKKKLVAKVQNMKYEGYRLTYGGYDFLACRTFAKRDTIYSVGNQIGTGKESDIYVVADNDEQQMVMKIHRLGRMSFRAIKSKRDYLKKGQSASWMYMSRLAAIKEFAFMKVLYDHDFPVPKPIDQSRHCLIMELIDAFPLRQIASVPSPGALYSSLMDLIVRLARSGLIHGDFNEFNILILDHRTLAEKDRDDETTEERDARIARDGGVDKPVEIELEGEEYEERKRREREGTLLEPVLIDFPQMVSTDHADAEYYFNRDVDCIRRFFRRRFKYESNVYPKFTANLQNGVREFDLDVEVAASGFSKGERKVLEEYMAELAAHDKEQGDEEEEEYSDEEVGSGQEEEGDEDEEDVPAGTETAAQASGRNFDDLTEEEKEKFVIQATTSHPNATGLEGATDRFGNLLIAEPEVEEEEDSEEEEDDDEEDGEEDEDEEDGESSDAGSIAPSQAPRMRPKRQPRDVTGIVTASLTRQQKSAERKHHGKKVASSNVLGRQKGSKKKASHNAAIKQGKKGDAFF